jgi:hypothetical protein
VDAVLTASRMLIAVAAQSSAAAVADVMTAQCPALPVPARRVVVNNATRRRQSLSASILTRLTARQHEALAAAMQMLAAVAGEVADHALAVTTPQPAHAGNEGRS